MGHFLKFTVDSHREPSFLPYDTVEQLLILNVIRIFLQVALLFTFSMRNFY